MEVIYFSLSQETLCDTVCDITSHLSEWQLSKRQKISVGKNVEKGETEHTVGRNVNYKLVQPLWKTA